MSERRRTPLPQVRGKEQVRGDVAEGRRLARAFRVSEADAKHATRGIQAVHPFPGRLHPVWVRRLVALLPGGSRVLDPFCGGGTVLVEARRSGMAALGSDLHPVAVRLSQLKTGPMPDLALLASESERCAEEAVHRRDTPFSRFAKGERSYPPHVLATLIALRDEIEQTPDPRVREALLFSLTPLLDKFSARRDRAAPRVSAGAVRDHFRDRAARWCELFAELEGKPPGDVRRADAVRLPWKAGAATAAITSPPYPGVYDYGEVQVRWARWLGLGDRELRAAAAGQVGQRATRADWLRDVRGALSELRRVVASGGPIYLVIADGALENRAVRVDRELERLAPEAGLSFVAAVSQQRPHFHGGTARVFAHQPRREHIVLLRAR